MMQDRIDPKKPFAVILLNLGGPDTVEAVRPFLLNLFSDRSIIKLPFQPLTARLIARRRAKQVAERYEMIGGGSPILKLTEAQAEALESGLKVLGYDCRVYIGMTYWHPFISETVERIIADGFEQILALSLFPHYSRATTGACMEQLYQAVGGRETRPKLAVIESWYDDAAYIEAMAECVEAGLATMGEERRQATVIFSAHSLPQDFVDDGDPYPQQIEATVAAVLERVGPLNWRLAYQSRSGPVKWLEPQTDAVIEELGDAGVKQVLVVPISFVSDHIETLYEIDIMYKELAEAHGIEVFARSPSLNSSGAFIKALVGIVRRKLAFKPAKKAI